MNKTTESNKSLLYRRYRMVYGRICSKYRSGGAMDGSALVRDTFYYS